MKDLTILKTNKTDTEKLQEELNELMFRKMEVDLRNLNDDVLMLDREVFVQSNVICKQHQQIKRLSLAQIFLTVAFVIGALIVGLWLGN